MNSVATGSRDDTRLARGMAWFGIGLGVAELLAPSLLAKLIGIRSDGRSRWLMRAMGLRELAHGAAILMRPHRPLPAWSRVAGDAIDAAALGVGAIARRTSTPRAIGALASVAGATALDVIAARRVQRAYDAVTRPVIAAVTINKPPLEVHAFFRKLDQLPLFMEYLESVEELAPTRSRWVAKLPLGRTVTWEAEVTQDVPGELIAWESLPGAMVKTRGRVTFVGAPGREATEVRVEMHLGLPGTAPSAALARVFAKPAAKGDLRRLKQLLETGEVLRSDASAHESPHPAQPSPTAEPAPPISVPPDEPTRSAGVVP